MPRRLRSASKSLILFIFSEAATSRRSFSRCSAAHDATAEAPPLGSEVPAAAAAKTASTAPSTRLSVSFLGRCVFSWASAASRFARSSASACRAASSAARFAASAAARSAAAFSAAAFSAAAASAAAASSAACLSAAAAALASAALASAAAAAAIFASLTDFFSPNSIVNRPSAAAPAPSATIAVAMLPAASTGFSISHCRLSAASTLIAASAAVTSSAAACALLSISTTTASAAACSATACSAASCAA
mmetsp:Transcript_86036/g.171830  ORF Transcript_86036/g.171830 Transcript_86036/m.171830 type:complete len:249 (-) Transcript_86036:58-804(-)